MRIGLYTPNYPGLTADGGIGSYTRTLGRALAGLGHAVHVLTPGDRPPAEDGPVRVHFCRTGHFLGVDKLVPGFGACWRVSAALRRLVREQKLDAVELANWEGLPLPYLWGRAVPAVVRMHTSSAETLRIDGKPPGRWDRWNVWRERQLARAADAVVTHSDAHRRHAAEEIGRPAAGIRLIPHGIETFPAFVRPPRPPGPPTVVFLGRLEHRKGTVELLQAVSRVLDRVPDARFVLIGQDRPHAPGGRTHAAYLEQDFPPAVRRAVTLAGRLPQADVDRHLQTADLFAAPSRYESFGLIFLEAMRWGTPVVGTTAGGIPEVVEHDRSGLLVPPEDPLALAAALVRLLENPDLRQTLGAAGRARAEGEFDAGTMARRMAGLYEEVIARRSRR